jgi:nickel-dependent lactate racemase
VAIVLDRETPQADQLLQGLCRVLTEAGVEAESVRIVQPADPWHARPSDPRGALPAAIRSRVGWGLHDPLDEAACAYLASTAGGERIYLARELIDADVVVCVGGIGFDDRLGFRGTLSSLYPGCSTADSLRRASGGGHVELPPESPRSLRELADEVGWLLGVQFVLQVLPAARAGVAAVLAGAADRVFAEGKQRLADLWQIDAAGRAELVVATVDVDAGGHGWPQVAAALETARRLVARDGRILLLTELADPPTEGIELIRDAHSPRESLQAIREQAQSDRRQALQLAQALDQANVYLLSRLPDQLVEDLFMVPVATPQEALRLLRGADECAVIGSAQHAYVRHTGEVR